MANQPNPFTIDPDRLDREWADQPGLTRRYGHAEADADFAAARAKSKVDVTYAQLELRIRRSPGLFALPEKPQVGEIKATIETHPDYLAAVEAAAQADYALRIAKAEVFAMVDRRKALERLVELRQIDYYAEREPRALSPGAAEHVSSVRKRAVREAPGGS